jgi:hypothetical protein
MMAGTAEGERWALPSLEVQHKVAIETTGGPGWSGGPVALPTELKRRSGFLVSQQFACLVEIFGAEGIVGYSIARRGRVL